MKTFLKATMCAVALTAVAGTAGQYPFPQNMKNPHGYTIPFADTDMIKKHYQQWKSTWYDVSDTTTPCMAAWQRSFRTSGGSSFMLAAESSRAFS